MSHHFPLSSGCCLGGGGCLKRITEESQLARGMKEVLLVEQEIIKPFWFKMTHNEGGY